MFLEKHYQNAYVTPNLDQALAKLRSEFGVGDFMCVEANTPVWTPGGEGVSTCKIALGWVGNLQYEVIQPIAGPVGIYSDAVSRDQLLRFHHIGMRVDDWDQLLGEVERSGRPIVYRGQTNGLKFLYLDGRDPLGHYLEYVWATPEMWKALGPR